jgi:ADP-ribosylglycohydrolase
LYARASEYAGLFAAEASAITHGHPLGIIPSYVFSTMIWFIVYEDLNIEEALNKAMKQYKKKFKLGGRKYRSYFIRLVEKAIELSKKDMLDIEAIREIGQGWVAEETFAIAIYSCLKHKDSFIDAVVCSINHEGDSDSTGAVTGNLMGALLGINSIPKYYIDNLEIKEVIFEIGTDLASEVPDNDELWTKKYINCKK